MMLLGGLEFLVVYVLYIQKGLETTLLSAHALYLLSVTFEHEWGLLVMQHFIFNMLGYNRFFWPYRILNFWQMIVQEVHVWIILYSPIFISQPVSLVVETKQIVYLSIPHAIVNFWISNFQSLKLMTEWWGRGC